MKLLITYALEAERGNIEMPNSSLTFCCTGIGKVSTAIRTYEALLKDKPDLVLNIGTAGTIHHQVDEIVLCSEFFDRDLVKAAAFGVNYRLNFEQELAELGLSKDLNLSNVVSTGDTFQTSLEEVGSENAVFDMESYASAEVCKIWKVPFLSVKYVTDVVGQNSIKHWEEKLLDAKGGLEAFLKELRLK